MIHLIFCWSYSVDTPIKYERHEIPFKYHREKDEENLGEGETEITTDRQRHQQTDRSKAERKTNPQKKAKIDRTTYLQTYKKRQTYTQTKTERQSS